VKRFRFFLPPVFKPAWPDVTSRGLSNMMLFYSSLSFSRSTNNAIFMQKERIKKNSENRKERQNLCLLANSLKEEKGGGR